MRAEKMTEAVTQKTLGESRVRTDFNTTNSDVVTQIKNKSAGLIDLVNVIAYSGENADEVQRLINLAQDRYEEAAMWAVKAATYSK